MKAEEIRKVFEATYPDCDEYWFTKDDLEEVELDGWFTAAQLRTLADLMEGKEPDTQPRPE